MSTGLGLRQFRVELKRNCVISRIIEAESEAEARKFVLEIIGLVDFALASGAKVSGDDIRLETIKAVDSP